MVIRDVDRAVSRPGARPGWSWSVVVCAYTEERWERLSAALASVAAQTVPADDVVLVVDHNDVLLRRARSAFSGSGVRVVASTGAPGLSGARNTGVTEATGDLVAFLDDDAEAQPTWLERLAVPFTDAAVVGAGGTAAPAWAGAGAPRWFPEEYNWVVGCSYKGLPQAPAPIRNPIGANMAFRRDAVEAAGGFSSDLGRVGGHLAGGEETDLAIRVGRATGGSVMLAPDAVVDHHVPAERGRLSYFLRRCYGEGRSKAVLARRVGGGDATSTERAYLRTLAAGVTGRVAIAARRRSIEPLSQAAVLVAGLAVTAAGFGVGLVASMLAGGRP